MYYLWERQKIWLLGESGGEIWKNMMANGQFESKHYHDEYSTKQTKKFRNFTSNVLKTHKISRKNFYKLTNVLPPSFVKLRFKSMIGKYIWIKQKRVSKGKYVQWLKYKQSLTKIKLDVFKDSLH